jgi:TfoX/Sxy family transcriptional regulator of competence genes
MAYDEGLEARVEELLEDHEGFEKKKMFGGICWLYRGNMCAGIWKDSLIVRCGPEYQRELMGRSHVKPFDITGKAMADWILVTPEGFDGDDELKRWIDYGIRFSSTLPPKSKK